MTTAATSVVESVRVVEELDRQPVARPVERGRTTHGVLDDDSLVVDRYLQKHVRQIAFRKRWR